MSFIILAEQNDVHMVRKAFGSIGWYSDEDPVVINRIVAKHYGKNVFYPIWDKPATPEDIFEIVTEEGTVMVCNDDTDEWEPKTAIIYKLASGDYAVEEDDLIEPLT